MAEIAKLGDAIARVVVAWACIAAAFLTQGVARWMWWTAAVGLLVLSDRALKTAKAGGGEPS
jgi:bacteriorhodopsin